MSFWGGTRVAWRVWRRSRRLGWSFARSFRHEVMMTRAGLALMQQRQRAEEQK